MSEPFVAPGDYRRRDQCGRLVPRNPFRDPIVLFRAFPGLAECFRVVVPPEHSPALTDRSTRLSGNVVDCVCGARSRVLVPGDLEPCSGGCGRWFCATGVTVRVARFEEDS
jgi:hypothetical protein